MEKLNLWCKLIACVSVISSVFSLVLPESKQKKAFNTLLSIILVFALIYPFHGKENALLIFDADSISLSGDDFENEAADYKNKALIYAAETETEKYLTEAFSEIGIDCECEVICTFKDELLAIERIALSGDINRNNLESVISKICEITNDETEVIINGERYG